MPRPDARHSDARHTKVPEIRKGDTVVVLAGKDAGKRGTVERVLIERRSRMLGARRVRRDITPLADAAVVVTGLNIAKRHTKPRQSQSSTDRMPKIQQGGILELAQPLAISKVMVVCPRCEKPTRIGHQTLDNGRRVRVCHHCGEQLEAKA
jgi:large subunit ribosomal protein L24